MLIAFDGPKGVGKARAADLLGGGYHAGTADQLSYAGAVDRVASEKGVAHCFTGVGWVSHLAHRLAEPSSETTRTPAYPVFAMPDAHLVIKKFHVGYVPDGLESINRSYEHIGRMLLSLNEGQDYALFKTVTLVDVYSTPLDSTQKLEIDAHSSPLHPWWGTPRVRRVASDLSLFDLLLEEDSVR